MGADPVCHPHVHGIATGGGLTPAGRWHASRPGFFLPVRVLGRVFRRRFLDRMREAFVRGRLGGFDTAAAFEAWASGLRAKEWVVYSKPPFGGPAQMLKYLARYTHRVAIGNSRLVGLDGGRVTFTYKDYAGAGRAKAMTLDGVEFLRRWAQHVLPRGFVKVRHYGLVANRRRGVTLEARRRLLAFGGGGPPGCRAEPVARANPCPACGVEAWVVGERFHPSRDVPPGPVVREDSS